MSVNKIKETFKNLFEENKKQKVIVIIGFIGILLIMLSEMIPSGTVSQPKSNQKTDYITYVSHLEKETESIISSIEGVGKCKVMLTLSQTDENIYAKNTEENKNESSFSEKNEYVFYEDNNNDTPILLKQYFPKVQGVVVVCSGGDNVQVRESVINSISSLYGISSTKISVSKLNR